MSNMIVLQNDGCIYVSPDGNDENSGATHDAPLRTIEAAVATVYQRYDTGGHNLTIKLSHGQYLNTNVVIRGPLRGGGKLIIEGDRQAPSKVIVDAGIDRDSQATFWAVQGGSVWLQGLHIRATKTVDNEYLPSCVRATFKGVLFLNGDIEFGDAAYTHLCAGNGQVIVRDSYRVLGDAMYHLFSSTDSGLATTGEPDKYVELVGDRYFSKAFAVAQTASVINWRLPFKGTARGKKFIASDGGAMTLKSIGANPETAPKSFPGDQPGEIKSGFFNGIAGAEGFSQSGATVNNFVACDQSIDLNVSSRHELSVARPSGYYILDRLKFYRKDAGLPAFSVGIYAIKDGIESKISEGSVQETNVPNGASGTVYEVDLEQLLLDRHTLYLVIEDSEANGEKVNVQLIVESLP